MLNFLKKILFKLFPGKTTAKVTAKFPTSAGTYEDLGNVNDQERPSYQVNYEVPEDIVNTQNFLIEPAPSSVESFQEPIVEKTTPTRARNKGKFVADNKITHDHNEAWVGGKAPLKKNNKKKKK